MQHEKLKLLLMAVNKNIKKNFSPVNKFLVGQIAGGEYVYEQYVVRFAIWYHL